MTWRVRTLLERRQITITTRVKGLVAAIQRCVATDGCILDPGNIVQRVEQLLHKTLTRCGIGILRSRQCDGAGPEMLRAETEILLAQPHKAGDQQRRAGKERDRKGDLRADKNLAEALLPYAAARSAAALF